MSDMPARSGHVVATRPPETEPGPAEAAPAAAVLLTMSVAEVAAALQTSVKAVYARAAKHVIGGELRVPKGTGRWQLLFDRARFEAWLLEEHAVPLAQPTSEQIVRALRERAERAREVERGERPRRVS
jgi:transposase